MNQPQEFHVAPFDKLAEIKRRQCTMEYLDYLRRDPFVYGPAPVVKDTKSAFMSIKVRNTIGSNVTKSDPKIAFVGYMNEIQFIVRRTCRIRFECWNGKNGLSSDPSIKMETMGWRNFDPRSPETLFEQGDLVFPRTLYVWRFKFVDHTNSFSSTEKHAQIIVKFGCDKDLAYTEHISEPFRVLARLPDYLKIHNK